MPVRKATTEYEDHQFSTTYHGAKNKGRRDQCTIPKCDGAPDTSRKWSSTKAYRMAGGAPIAPSIRSVLRGVTGVD